MAPDKPTSPAPQGFLAGLLRDQRGSTMAMMAAAIVPMIGLVGGALDISRLYLVKARMQQACDAGALAGRKRMGGGQWTQANGAPKKAAEDFFDSNFMDEAYGTTNRKRVYTEAAGKVTGAAEAVVPMTLMRIFGSEEVLVDVVCDAEMRLPNTDVMFVLDVTGSMSQDPAGTEVNSGPTSKIVALRSAVKCFYEIVARIDTSEVCTTGTPSGGVTNATQVRFGFVPYATNVNVGRLLPTSYFADTWNYQSRRAETRPVTTEQQATGTPALTGDSTSAPSQWANNPNTKASTPYNGNHYLDVREVNAACDSQPAVDPTVWGSETIVTNSPSSRSSTNGQTTTTVTTYQTTQTGTEYDYDKATLNKKCFSGYWRTRTHVRTRTYSRTDTTTRTTRNLFVRWHYAQHPVNVSALKNGAAWNASFQHPIGNTAVDAETITPKTIAWEGCIEERATVPATTYTSTTGGAAKDLDIDTKPTSGDPGSLWGPALHDLIYLRTSTANSIDDNDANGFKLAADYSATDYSHLEGPDANGVRRDNYFCPTEAKKLQQWPISSTFENYVNGLRVGGNTYHDIGLLWGARFISPTGIFDSENALTPAGGEIERHLIFMTDGQTCTGVTNYGPYGFAWFDRRWQTDPNVVPTAGCESESGDGSTLTQQVNARYSALCTAVKNKNITLWVIWFGQSRPNLEARLTGCATSGRFFAARNSADLQTTFASIANQISQLRLTS